MARPKAPRHARVAPPGSVSVAAGSTSRPSERPPLSSAVAAGNARRPRQSTWRSALAGPEMLADLQGLMSLKNRGESSINEKDCVYFAVHFFLSETFRIHVGCLARVTVKVSRW